MLERILAHIQCMAKEDILGLISARRFSDIKASDPNPEFRVYGVGHEGTATARILDDPGVSSQTWYKRSIQAIASIVKEGLKFFYNHDSSNSTEGRMEVGEVVGKGTQEKDGKLHAFVVAYIYPQFRDIKLDVASIEADIIYSKENGVAQLKDITRITGIALGDSAVNQPGFPGATLQACVQAFEDREGRGHYMGGNAMTIDELVKAIKEGKFVPSQLFDKEALTRDSVVTEFVKAEKQGEYEHRKRTDREFDDARSRWDKEKKDYEDKLKTSLSESIKFKIGDTFKALATERKLDENQTKFIQERIGQFKTEETDADKVKIDLDKYLDTEIKEHEKYHEMLTGKKYEKTDPENKEDPEKKKKSPGVPGSDDQVADEDSTDPEKNDFIPVEGKK